MIHIERFVFNIFQVNTYVLYDETGEAVVVDAACKEPGEQEKLAGFIARKELKVMHHINTHCHIDHILGNEFMEARYGVRPEYHKASIPFFYTAREIGASFGYKLEHIPEAGRYLEEGDVVRFGNSELNVLYTPGHADGHISLYCEKEKFVLTGDVLFRETVGRTDLPSGNFDVLMDSIREKLFRLDDEVVVYPGHGPETSIGYEKINNPFIR